MHGVHGTRPSDVLLPLFAVGFLCSMGLVRSGAYIKGSEYVEI